MKTPCRNVKPLMSADFCEARRRAVALYKAFYRYIPYVDDKLATGTDGLTCSPRHGGNLSGHPSNYWLGLGLLNFADRMICAIATVLRAPPILADYILKYFDIAKSEQDCRIKLREMFYKNACVTDVRVIDMLVIKGYMELAEVKHNWQQKGHILANWNPTLEPKPCDFLGKFLAGMD